MYFSLGYVWGFDIGIGSCGWAVLDMLSRRIVDMGVRLWDVPQEPKTKVSFAATRRSARSIRRNLKRTADRKKHCLKLLIQEGIVPAGETAKWLQTAKGEPQTIKLRVSGLDRLLSDREWAQVLYSICSRRGYILQGETGADADSEGKKVLAAISDNKQAMSAEGFRTVGEMLASKGASRNKGGDYSLCVTNEMLVDEIKELFSAQKRLGNPHSYRSFLNDYLEILLWQKDVSNHDAAVYETVGYCSYEIFKNEKRAAKASLSFELCRAYEQLGHIRIVFPDGTETPLPAFVRQNAIAVLFSPIEMPKNKTCKVTYSDLRKQLDLSAAAYFKGVESDKEKTLKVADPKAWAIIRKTLSTELVTRLRNNRELADAVCEALAYASSSKSLKSRLEETTELEDAEIAEVLKLPYSSKAFNGYGNRCLKALDLLIDSFEDEEDVITLSDAEQSCGLQAARLYGQDEKGEFLPPYSFFDPTNKNPVVLRVMGQVRKVANALYSKYGAPAAIRIELGRELKQSERERQAIAKRNREIHDHREALRSKIAEEIGKDPELVSPGDIRKVEYHEAQGGWCPYCAEPIHYDDLIESLKTNDKAFEIDHILPFSRTCDDSQSNKVLVHSSCNQNKGNRTPYEWITESGKSWDKYMSRVLQMTKIPRSKRQKLLNQDLSEKKEAEFIERNLNDMRYASREAKAYFEKYLAFAGEGKQHVFAVAGGATAQLRNAWGIKKVREEDDLHHAVDAAVIAACTPSLVIKIAHASENKHKVPKDKRAQLFKDTEPWAGFADEVVAWRDKIVPSRKVEHGVTGRVFEDTVYAFKGMTEDGAYGILTSKGKEKRSSNFVLRDDGSAVLPDGIAFVRLWWDPSIKVRGRADRSGAYLIEPVYYADIPALRAGTYIPRSISLRTDKKDRSRWDPIPCDVLQTQPLTLFRNDAVSYKGVLLRFNTVSISTNSWSLLDPLNNRTQITKGYPLSGITSPDELQLINEDVLGHSLSRFKVQLEE